MRRTSRPGVVSIGVERNGFKVEAGAFHGREPDEDRLDLDTAALDSYAVRASWADGPWSFQVSGGHLKTPESKSPYDQDRLTASASFFKGDERHSIAWTRRSARIAKCSATSRRTCSKRRGEPAATRSTDASRAVAKDILDAGFHPIGVAHTHRQSQIGALTAGYIRDFAAPAWGTFGVGGDITGYYVPENLSESYGSPVSFHVFLRYRGRAGARDRVTSH